MSVVKLKKNLGVLDRIIRAFLAIVVVALYGAGFIKVNAGDLMGGALFWIAAMMGGIFLITSALGFCPVYSALKLSTCSKEEAV